MPQPWSKSLVRSSFSEWLVDDAIREANGAIAPEAEALLRTSAEKKSQVSELKKALSAVKPLISTGTYEALHEELAEIREDFSWAKSNRGKYVLEIQDWVQTFHADMRSQKRFEGLYVGGHESLEIVYVVGKAASVEVVDELVAFLHKRNPPRKIMTKVTISAGNKG